MLGCEFALGETWVGTRVAINKTVPGRDHDIAAPGKSERSKNMSVQKKSLISQRTAVKKAILATPTEEPGIAAKVLPAMRAGIRNAVKSALRPAVKAGVHPAVQAGMRTAVRGGGK